MLIGYARVSTIDQETGLQRAALEDAGCERVFEEKASGAQRERPELAAGLSFMRKGDTLVVWKLDRLARSLRQLIETVEGLEARGVSFRSLTENIDTTTHNGRFFFHVFGALAEFERGLIRERTVAGLVAARAKGRVGGRPKRLDGPAVAAAKAMLADPDMGVREVCKRLGVSVATLYRHLPAARSAAATGEQVFGADASQTFCRL
jgi:DNA invertase Pin-like site-specific DNA recombinase